MGESMSDTFPIEPNNRYAVVAASAGQTAITIPFPFIADEDIALVRISAGGVETELEQPNDYTVAGAGEDAGGTATLLVPALDGQSYRVLGNAELKRTTSIIQGGRFSARTQDNELDRLVIIAQEQAREIARTFRVPYGAAAPTIEIGEDGQLPMYSGGNLVPGPSWSDLGGIAGPGVPIGGSQYQVIVKVSSADYDTEWRTLGLELLDFTNTIAKTTPIDTDVVLGLDSAASLVPKRFSFANIRAWILTWLAAALGPLYPAVTAKASPLTADGVLITDSADANKSKLLTLGNLRTWLTSFYDTRFSPGYGYLFGGETANNATDLTNDVDIAATITVDNTTLGLITAGTMTKRLDANWAPGSANGGRYSGAAITNTTYHIWAVSKADGSGGDYYMDPSPVRATVLAHLQAETGGAAYTNARLIWSIVRSGGSIKRYRQKGDECWWYGLQSDYNTTAGTTSYVNQTLTLPTGVEVVAIVSAGLRTTSGTGENYMLVLPTWADAGRSASSSDFTVMSPSDGGRAGSVSEMRILADSSQQIKWQATGAGLTVTIFTLGFVFNRGRS